MQKVNGVLNISADVDCPDCSELIDLMQIQRFTDDGFIYKEVLEGADGPGCDDLDEEVTCPECGCTFIVGAIEW